MAVYKIEYDYDVTYKATPWLYHTKKGTRLVKANDNTLPADVLERFMQKRRRPKSLKGLGWSFLTWLVNRQRATAIIFAPKNSSRETNMIVVKRMKSAK